MTLISQIFAMELDVSESLARGTIIYWAIYVLFRAGGRRNIGSLGFADIVVVILVSEAVSNALSAGSKSLTDGLLIAATIIFWSCLVDRLCYFFPRLNTLLAPSQLCLIKNGKMDLRSMRREFITRTELLEQLRIQGIASMGDVKRAYLEANGEISVIRYEEPKNQGETTYSD
ncbi:MAG: YetF domain-containing protein [Candidimonas sp.]